MNWTHSESERQRRREFQSRGKSLNTLYLALAVLDLFAFFLSWQQQSFISLSANNDWLFHMVSLVDDNFHLLVQRISILFIHIIFENGKVNLNMKIISNEIRGIVCFLSKKWKENEWSVLHGRNSTDSHNFVVVKWIEQPINAWNHNFVLNTDLFQLCVLICNGLNDSFKCVEQFGTIHFH